jgi:2-succinyl-5-enolpyruvyl-6-hydroxy-3-cyclohexene-1-carboxylate synthase
MKLAEKVLQEAFACGVRDFCICAGARNSPFVFLLDKSSSLGSINIFSFFEERSASFFALGRIERDDRPVAVITTSGTAAAELLPAAVEATYTGKPLLLITADRPSRYRGTGAPQAIEQVGIFSAYVEKLLDLDAKNLEVSFTGWTRTAPLQVNVCFEEPLIDDEVKSIEFSQGKVLSVSTVNNEPYNSESIDQPLVILGALPEKTREQVLSSLIALSKKSQFCIYAEAISGLRTKIFENKELRNKLIFGGEESVQKIAAEKNTLKSVLRIGGIPTLRFWRDLELKYLNLPVVSISDNRFTGLSRKCTHFNDFKYLENICSIVKDSSEAFEFEMLDQLQLQKLNFAMKNNALSEPSLMQKLSFLVGDHSAYLGNSLPIRQWDLASSYKKSPSRIFANRGANGIDGQISTFLGWASDTRENWAIVGDLTALYDLTSLWADKFIGDSICRIVVINNGGGHIFKNMFQHEAFLNRHELQFKKWAEMWGWDYLFWKDVPEISTLTLPKKCIIEVRPDEIQTEKFWQEYKSK